MKRIYIKPATELVKIRITPLLDGSDSHTTWGVDDQDIDPNEQPDPNGDAKQSSGFWEGAPQSPNIWGDEE